MCNHQLVFEYRTVFTRDRFESLPALDHGIIHLGKRTVVRAELKPSRDANHSRSMPNHPTETTRVVIKGIRECLDRHQRDCLEKDIRREVTILCLLQDSSLNIQPLLGTIALDRFIPPSPVFGYCENGTITEYVQGSSASHLDRLRLLRDAAEGINYMHDRGIIHSDLKGANILVDDDGRAKIIDFGSSFVNDCTCAIGPHDDEKIWDFLTYRYTSFEIWDEGAAPTTKSDVWAFGCIALEVQLGIEPYAGDEDYLQVMDRICTGQPPADIQLGPETDAIARAVAGVIAGCWEMNPAVRSDIQTVMDRLAAIPTAG